MSFVLTGTPRLRSTDAKSAGPIRPCRSGSALANAETTRRVEPPTCCASVAPRPFCWSEMRGESAMDSPASGLLVRGVAAVLSWPERSSSWPRSVDKCALFRLVDDARRERVHR